MKSFSVAQVLLPAALFFAAGVFAQQAIFDPLAAATTADQPNSPAEPDPHMKAGEPASGSDAMPLEQAAPNAQAVPESQRQPKRILGVMPNYRAVSAGEIPPPPTLKQAFKIATQNSFDYSSFVFVGITSAIADASGAHKDLGGGVGGYWAYYWRGFVDKTDGNYLVIFALPTVFHQDERYYAMGKGGIAKRTLYAASRILITPDYHGHSSFNASELLGRAMAQGISVSYYPSQDRTASELAAKWGFALLRDAATNVFREFWPDIATHVLHRHP